MKNENTINKDTAIFLPKYAEDALIILERANFEAWIVGGYIRDFLLYIDKKDKRKEYSQDIDIATNACWQETKQAFENANWKVYELGTKFGTVSVLPPKNKYKTPYCIKPLEITSFRYESNYEDGRHPNKVIQAKTITEDLKRRDFTINAIAYNPKMGLYDPYEGNADIHNQIIKTVGNAKDRFSEDYLRILRALRFSSQLTFKIDEECKNAIWDHKTHITEIAIERNREELSKLLMGKNAKKVLFEYSEILFKIIPEMKILKGFDQLTKYHCYDIYEHTLVVVDKMPRKKYVDELGEAENLKLCTIGKWAALLHDIGKQNKFSIDSKGQGHFFGHPKASSEMAKKILKRFKFSNKFINSVNLIIRWHDLPMIATEKSVKKTMTRFAEQHCCFSLYWMFKIFCDLRRADSLAHAPNYRENYKITDQIEEIFHKIYKENQVYSLKQLNIKGFDLIEHGIKPGPEISRLLNLCLKAVIDDKIENKKEKLIDYALNVTNHRYIEE